MSLRSRVALLILALFAVGMLAALMRALQDARQEVSDGLQVRQTTITELLALVHGSADASGKQELSASVMERLSKLEGLGYLHVSSPGDPAGASGSARDSSDVPNWFMALLSKDMPVIEQVIGTYNSQPVVLRANPDNLLQVIWQNTRSTLVSQLGTLLLLNIVIYLMLGRWLSPIERIIDGLHEMEKGDYTSRVVPSGLPELDQITHNVNHLTDVLAASKTENVRLQSQAISAQEHERQRLAQELHDSLGQAISAIKAVAVSIAMRSRAQLPDIADSAQSIEKISENAYTAVRELMTALHPSVLDELGLATALEQMVEDWNHHHESVFCRLELDGDFDDLDEDQAINVYRIVQESLTNVIKHAAATQVQISFGGSDPLKLSIRDNGSGYDPDTGKRGMGLWNIKDRVNLLGGKLQIDTRPGGGVGIYIEFPRPYAHRKQAT